MYIYSAYIDTVANIYIFFNFYFYVLIIFLTSCVIPGPGKLARNKFY